MIEVKDIYKSFGEKDVLKGVSATFEAGNPSLIIGASGSGKSVLMKTMVGLIPPDSGSIIYDGRDFTNMAYKQKREIRREIGMLFQGSALFDSLTVEENVGFPLRMFSKMSVAEQKDRINWCLDRVNLQNVNHLFPSEISGGMQKRVGIARAIALEPKYLFVDEPNSGLDPLTSRLIDELIVEITEELHMITIINTHDMKTVMDIGSKIVFIHQGHKWWEGKKEDVRQTDNPELREFIKASLL